MQNAFIIISLTFSGGWRSGILQITAMFVFRIRLTGSEYTESMIWPAPARSSKKVFEEGSIGWRSGVNLAITAFAVVSCAPVQIIRFSEFWNLLFFSLNTSSSWTQQFVVYEFGRDCGPPVLLVLSPAAFTSGKLLRNYPELEHPAMSKKTTVKDQNCRKHFEFF